MPEPSVLTGWRRNNWVNLVKVVLPSGNHAVYSNPAKWMTADEVRLYGLHIATRLRRQRGDGENPDKWHLINRLPGSTMPEASTEDASMFENLPMMA